MKNKPEPNDVSRRKLMKVAAVTLALAGTKPMLLAKPAESPTAPATDERDTLFAAITFWVAVTNPALPPDQLDSATAANLTGLPNDGKLQAAVNRVKNNPNLYKYIQSVFEDITSDLTYPPNECPKHLTTLKQISSLKPGQPCH